MKMEKTAGEQNTTDVKSADGSWGWLSDLENYGRPGDSPEDFQLITYEEAMDKYKDFMHAGHAMYFSKTDQVNWKLYKTRANIMRHQLASIRGECSLPFPLYDISKADDFGRVTLKEMQMRFDGMLGFPGGLVEKGEDPVTGVNRELVEEIGIIPELHSVELKDRVTTHLHGEKKLVLHFFVKEIAQEVFKMLEERALQAEEYGIEMLGTIRPPLFTMGDNFRGFPAFLTNIFCGNAKEQLLSGIVAHDILTKEEVKNAIESSKNHKRSDKS